MPQAMNRCVVNVALGKRFLPGQDRLARSLAETGYKGGVAFWRDELPPGSPPHEEVPFAFKVHALECVVRRGYRILLWADASVWFVRPPEIVMDRIEHDGYYLSLMPDDHKVGRWCSDAALVKLDATREELLGYPVVCAGFFGIDMNHPIGSQILWQMSKRARDGSFVGPWTNENGQASSDGRVGGHRHDQTALGTIAGRMGLVPEDPPGMFVMDAHEERTGKTVAVARGLL